jgi:hypothetical protein
VGGHALDRVARHLAAVGDVVGPVVPGDGVCSRVTVVGRGMHAVDARRADLDGLSGPVSRR